MLIRFQGNDSILDSKPFTDDEVQFNLLHLVRESESPYLFTNKNRSIIIGQSAPKYPAWIWTENNVTKNDIEELKDDFTELYKDVDILTFVAKPDIAILLAEYYSKVNYKNYSVSLQMESFQCESVIEARQINGQLKQATTNDINIISEFLSGFVYDCFGKETTSEEQLETAKVYIESKNLYIWECDSKIISMANIAHNSKRNVRINGVYTIPDMRGKGFGAKIVSELCKIILSKHKNPVLYTDLRNPASNKAYKNVGFTECGKVTQISFDFESDGI